MDNRYSHEDLPQVGAVVLSPNGRLYRVHCVIDSARVVCWSVTAHVRRTFQANDLRRVQA